MKTALLISTYNWPEALDVVLQSARAQTIFPDEILIADDGSTNETKKLIEQFKKTTEIPVHHTWQEDKGFRRTSILNKTLARTNADYIIQIDGDCIMHRDFVKDHIAFSEANVYLFGSRVNIKPQSVQKVLENQIRKFSFFSNDIKNKSRNLRIPLFRTFFSSQSRFSKKVRGCNISYWHKDFIAVNGYNESMEGWGREDSEFVLRLLNNGIDGKRLRYGGIIYHIYHPEKSKEKLAENHKIQERTILEKKIWCSNGVDKYLTQSL